MKTHECSSPNNTSETLEDSPTQQRVYEILEKHGELTSKKVIARYRLSRSAVSSAIGQLVESELLERGPDLSNSSGWRYSIATPA